MLEALFLESFTCRVPAQCPPQTPKPLKALNTPSLNPTPLNPQKALKNPIPKP